MKFLHKNTTFLNSFSKQQNSAIKERENARALRVAKGQAVSALGKSFDTQGEVTRILIIPTLEFT